jgi:hypothetical protein
VLAFVMLLRAQSKGCDLVLQAARHLLAQPAFSIRLQIAAQASTTTTPHRMPS